MKILIKLILTLLVLAGLAIGGLWFFTDYLVKQAIERIGPEVTGTAVTLSKAQFSLQNGEGQLQGLTIGNPAGFKAMNAFELASVDVKVDTNSLRDEVLVIQRIVIDSPVIVYEPGKPLDNLRSLQQQITANVSDIQTKLTGKPQESKKKTESTKKMIIDHFSIRNIQVKASHPLLGNQSIDFTLPPIEFSHIGRAKGGATAAEITKEVVDELIRRTKSELNNVDEIKNAAKQLEKELKGRVEEELNQLEASKDKIKGLLDRFK